MKLTKEEAVKKLFIYAKIYQDKRLNKMFLIIYKDRINLKLNYIEVLFLKRNFQHLTGIDLIDKNGNILHGQSHNFFRKCIQKKLTPKEIAFKQDGTTQLKFEALPTLMNINKVTKIVGDYNNLRPYLCVDKVVGGVNFCLGLKQNRDDDLYFPASALNFDIRDLSIYSSQVIAIFSKENIESIYETVQYTAKGVNLNNINFPLDIKNVIKLTNYTYK